MSWEEELEEGPGREREESDALTDRPENELNELEKDLNELGESLCSDLQSLEDASLVPEVGSQEVQEDQWSKKDGQMNGTMEESLDTETIVEERTETQPDKEEEHQKEHKVANDTGSNGSANGGIASTVTLNVEIEEPEEKSAEPLSPKVSSTVALFKSRSLTDYPGSQGKENPLRSPIRTFKINVGSKTGVQIEEQSTKSPITSTPEEQDQAPIKVSELKKRFEH